MTMFVTDRATHGDAESLLVYVPEYEAVPPGASEGTVAMIVLSRLSETVILVRIIFPVLVTIPLKDTVWPGSITEGLQANVMLIAGRFVS